MSQGIFRSSENGPYVTRASSIRRDIGTMPPDVFQQSPYIDSSSRSALARFNISPEKHGVVNVIIGDFLQAIQDASFVPVEVIQERTGTLPGTESGGLWRETYLFDGGVPPSRDHGPVYYSTLSPEALVATIRQQVPKLLRDIIGILDEGQHYRLRARAAGNRMIFEALAEKLPPIMQTLPPPEFTGGGDNIYKNTDFFTPESQALATALGATPAIIADLNGYVGMVARAVHARAELSAESTRFDLTNVPAQDNPEVRVGASIVRPNILYSTLNPKDFIRMMRGHLYGLLGGIAFSIHRARSVEAA